MTRIAAALILFCALLQGKEKKLPSGDAADERVSLTASVLDSAELKQIFGSDFDNNFAVLEVTLTPKGDQPLEVHLEDFLLRSDQNGTHSEPFVASQIAGSGTLVVHQAEQPARKGGFGGGFGGIMMGGGGMGPGQAAEGKSEIKNSDKRDPMLDVLKRKILAEKPVREPVTGLLFFPLDKEKPKNLTLIYTSPAGKLRVRFK
ncbi:MAG: hypothetical protein M3N54_11975 [Acidobacteriota bacterium]|nr:hypothetical protein [Acidobacteriota bacterium]